MKSKDANYHCMGSFMSGNLFFQGMMYLVTLVFGGWLIAHGQMEAADLAMYALIYRNLYQSDPDSGRADRNDAERIVRFSVDFLDVVETEPEIVDAPGCKALTEIIKGHVCYEDVSFHYSDDDTLGTFRCFL